MVTDDADQRALFTLVLTSYGYPVDAVADAESALERLAEHTYAVLLTDYELPRMNGPELIGLVRQRWPSLRIVLMSNHTHIRELAAQLDVDGYFAKMEVFELPRVLHAVLECDAYGSAYVPGTVQDDKRRPML
ncbi:MAG: response regulator [Armatimonadota bacterium]